MPSVFFKDSNGADLGDTYLLKSAFAEGTLYMWGFNVRGETGNNVPSNYESAPVQTIAGGINWKQIAVGGDNFVGRSGGIKTDGTLWMWGTNDQFSSNYGMLGTGDQTHRSSPVQTVAGGTNWKQLSLGYTHNGAVKTDGTLWMWGDGAQGKLGDNTIANKSSPVQTVAGGTNWKQVSCGDYYTGAIKTDGTLWMWGTNIYGNLGTNDLTHRSSPIQTTTTGTNWKLVSCGSNHTGAIKTDGTLWMWGVNGNGQLGLNDTTNRSSPIQTVFGGTNWKQVNCGANHTGAIKTDGTLWMWGINSDGQLGINDTTYRSSPVQTVAGGTNWKQVACGSYCSGAVKTDGTLWMWGDNFRGPLGTGNETSRSSPVQTITGGTNWKQVDVFGFHSGAVRDDTTTLY